jgi:hypothetical protein
MHRLHGNKSVQSRTHRSNISSSFSPPHGAASSCTRSRGSMLRLLYFALPSRPSLPSACAALSWTGRRRRGAHEHREGVRWKAAQQVEGTRLHISARAALSQTSSVCYSPMPRPGVAPDSTWTRMTDATPASSPGVASAYKPNHVRPYPCIHASLLHMHPPAHHQLPQAVLQPPQQLYHALQHAQRRVGKIGDDACGAAGRVRGEGGQLSTMRGALPYELFGGVRVMTPVARLARESGYGWRSWDVGSLVAWLALSPTSRALRHMPTPPPPRPACTWASAGCARARPPGALGRSGETAGWGAWRSRSAGRRGRGEEGDGAGGRKVRGQTCNVCRVTCVAQLAERHGAWETRVHLGDRPVSARRWT